MLKRNRLISRISHSIRTFSENAKEELHLDDFETDFERNHVPINFLQKIVLSVGSAAVSICDPHRGDMIACLGETTGYQAAKLMTNKMQATEEGREILTQRPRINSTTVDLAKLKTYPEGTVGKVYSNFLISNRVTPDSRPMVRFVDDIDIAYVIQRYREVHDLIHTTLEMPTHMLGEVTVKWVEAIQTTLPMCIGGALFGPIRLKPKHRKLYKDYYLPWAIKTGYNSKFLVGVHFEKRWEQPLSDFHKEMGIIPFASHQTEK